MSTQRAGQDTVADFARDLTRARQSAGLSIRDLSRRTGIPTATLGDYFAGRHLPPTTRLEVLDEVLDACGVPKRARATWRRRLTDLHQARRQGVAHRTPYPGLRSFQLADHDLFFGRERLVDRLVGMVQAALESSAPVLAVVGPSGAGKSSLLRAGLQASLSALGCRCEVLTPDQVVEWCAGTDPAGQGWEVLVVDQLERAWTRGDPQAASALVGALDRWTQARPGRVVVLGLRADFYGSATAHPLFAEALQERQLVVGPLDAEGMRAAIEGPAREVGLTLDPGLADLILADIRTDEVGSVLPHLAHVLQTMWEGSNRRVLTVATYREAGGVEGAIRQSAEQTLAALGEEKQQIARDLLLRMVTIADGGSPTLRMVSAEELASVSDRALPVLHHLVRGRLVTAREEDAGLSHESLLVAWPRLREWVETERADLSRRDELEREARGWDEHGRGVDRLLRGTRLASVTDWSARSRGELSPVQQDFVEASTRLARREEQVRLVAHRRRRHLLVLVTVLALVTTTASLVATSFWQDARQERDLALSRQIAVASAGLREVNPALSQQLAVAAFRTAPTREGRSALLDATSGPVLPPWTDPEAVLERATTLHDGEHVVLAGPSGGLVVVRTRDGAARDWRVVGRLPVQTADGEPVALTRLITHPDEPWVVAAGSSAAGLPSLTLVDLSDPTAPLGVPLEIGPVPTALAFVEGGDVLVVAGASDEGGSLHRFAPGSDGTWEPRGGAQELPGVVEGLAASSDGSVLAAAISDGLVLAWAVVDDDLAPVGEVDLEAGLFDLAMTPDGRAVVAVGRAGLAHWITVGDEGLTADGDVLVSDTNVFAVEIDPQQELVAAAGFDGTVSMWQLGPTAPTTEVPVLRLPTPKPVIDLAVGPHGRWVVATLGGVVHGWDPVGPLLPLAVGNVCVVGTSHEGERLMTSVGPPGPGSVDVWDPAHPHAPDLLHRLMPPDPEDTFTGGGAISPDGALAAAGTYAGQVVVWRLDGTAPEVVLHQPVADDAVVFTLFSPDNETLLLTSRDGTLRVVDIAGSDAGTELGQVVTPGAMYSAALSRTGLVAVSDDTDAVHLVHLDDPGAPVGRIDLEHMVYGLDFAPDATTLALAAADNRIHLYDVSDPARPTPAGEPLTGPSTVTNSVKFSPDGDRLAVAAVEGEAWIFARTGEGWDPAEVLTAGLPSLQDVTWSADGEVLLGGALGGRTRLWLTDVDRAVAQLCEQSGPDLTVTEWEGALPGTDYRPPCTGE